MQIVVTNIPICVFNTYSISIYFTGNNCITNHADFLAFLNRPVLSNTLWLLTNARGGRQPNAEPSNEYVF